MEYAQHKSKRNIPAIPTNILDVMLISGKMKPEVKEAIRDIFNLKISQYEAAKRHNVNVGNVSRCLGALIKKYEMLVDKDK